jgi:hypothetical protein
MKFLRYEACPKCRENGKDSRGDNLGVWSDGSVHCFACGYHPFKISTVWTPKEEIKYVNESVLPSDFSREIPNFAWKWILQYGLPYSYWRPYCGYSENYQRLILTVGNPVAFSIGRYLPRDEPNSTERKWKTWGKPHEKAYSIGEGEVTVLTEDLVSAHKVGQITEAIPLFGTQIHPCHVEMLRKGSRSPVVLWLDWDQWGSSQKLGNRLESLINRPVVVRHTKKDPKELTFNEIKEVINVIL